MPSRSLMRLPPGRGKPWRRPAAVETGTRTHDRILARAELQPELCSLRRRAAAAPGRSRGAPRALLHPGRHKPAAPPGRRRPLRAAGRVAIAARHGPRTGRRSRPRTRTGVGPRAARGRSCGPRAARHSPPRPERPMRLRCRCSLARTTFWPASRSGLVRSQTRNALSLRTAEPSSSGRAPATCSCHRERTRVSWR